MFRESRAGSGTSRRPEGEDAVRGRVGDIIANQALPLALRSSSQTVPSLCVQLAAFGIWSLLFSVCQLVVGISVSEREHIKMRRGRAERDTPTQGWLLQLQTVALLSQSVRAGLQTCPEPGRSREWMRLSWTSRYELSVVFKMSQESCFQYFILFSSHTEEKECN
jgi:hypothetical protein